METKKKYYANNASKAKVPPQSYVVIFLPIRAKALTFEALETFIDNVWRLPQLAADESTDQED